MNSAFPAPEDKLDQAPHVWWRQGGPSSVTAHKMPVLLQYWRIVVRWRWLILSILLVALTAAFIVTMFTRPLYTATATIEISRQKDKIVNVEGVEPDASDVDMEFYLTQYSLLRARSLAERVSADLRLAQSSDFFETFGEDPDGNLFTDDTDVRLSPQDLEKRRKLAVEILLDHISIAPIRGSSLVDVSFTSSDPALSQRVANAWTAGFIASNLDRRFEATSYARRFLEDRLEQLRRRLEDSERQLVQYAANQRIITIPSTQEGGGPGGERSLIADDLARLNAELAEATGDRVRAESRLRTSNGASREVLNNAAVTALRQKRAEIAAEYSNLLARFAPEYPSAMALASQIQALDRSIVQEEARVQSGVGKDYRDALAREEALRSRVEDLKNNALDLRRRSIQYNIFQREADTNRQLYDGLLQRYKEIGVAGGVGTNNVLIVDQAALPDEPTSPSLPLNILLGLLGGSVIAAATIFALEQIDEAIKDPADARRVLDVSVLGAVPTVHDALPQEVLRDRKSSLAEAYLSVQTNLRFSTDHGVPKSLAITSTRPAEGKSTTCYALAQTLARTGKKVILIDSDMRSPSVHHLMGIENRAGLSNFLAGEDEVTNLIFPVESLGIDAMAAGPQPPNAAELLTSTRLQLLISRLLSSYDHVMIDAPPVLGLADAPLITSQVEGVVYAVEAGGPKSSAINTALGRLRAANANILGIVITKFEEKKAHYGYGYEYGYGYGQSLRSE